MGIYKLLGLCGGLALFLYGMQLMSSSLFKVGGVKLERTIEKLTKNRLKAVFFGAAITALIQSSSGATVMVVGFVNAGLMRLSQAIGIIMGANIGTTATAWILSLLGIESNSLLFNLFKPSTFAPILALLGVVGILFNKKMKKKAMSEAIFGFAVLMLGMTMMSDAVKPLAQNQSFVNAMASFKNPILSLIIGIIVTAIIQSSSASVGILQALSVTGVFSIHATIPIILGQNIGTCVTSLLSSVGTSRNSKRAACAHLAFNILGAILFALGYYLIVAIWNPSFDDRIASPFIIAVIHSIFNLSVTIILLPFIKLIERLTYLIIPKSTEELMQNKFAKLDDKFIQTPSFAMDQCYDFIAEMGEMAIESLEKANGLNYEYNEENVNKIKIFEKDIDKYEDNLKRYSTKISQYELSIKNTQRLSAYSQCINDFERISDHILLISEYFEKMHDSKDSLSNKAKKEIDTISKACLDVLKRTVEVFKSGNQDLALTVEPLDSLIQDLQRKAVKKHINRMRKLDCTPKLGIYFADILNSYVRIADYCSNIAIAFIHDNNELVNEHEYQEKLKENNELFKAQKEKFAKDYAIKL